MKKCKTKRNILAALGCFLLVACTTTSNQNQTTAEESLTQ